MIASGHWIEARSPLVLQAKDLMGMTVGGEVRLLPEDQGVYQVGSQEAGGLVVSCAAMANGGDAPGDGGRRLPCGLDLEFRAVGRRFGHDGAGWGGGDSGRGVCGGEWVGLATTAAPGVGAKRAQERSACSG
jgi:hypothetical protein